MTVFIAHLDSYNSYSLGIVFLFLYSIYLCQFYYGRIKSLIVCGINHLHTVTDYKQPVVENVL